MLKDDPVMPLPDDAPIEWSAWESICVEAIQRKKVKREWMVTSCGTSATGKTLWQAVDRVLEKRGATLPPNFKRRRL